MNTETLDRLEADIANAVPVGYGTIIVQIQELSELLSIARRAADVEGMARVAAASKCLDWDGKSRGTEYANHHYWLPIGDAISRHILGDASQPVSVSDIGEDEEVGR